MKLLIVSVLVVVAFATIAFVRPVGAEDDCAFQTVEVARWPMIGLVCIGEGLRP